MAGRWRTQRIQRRQGPATVLQLSWLLKQARVSATNPFVPRFVRLPVEPGNHPLLDLLCEETIHEATVKDAIRNAKALGDAIHSRHERREVRLRAVGFEDPDAEQRKANLASNVAIMEWPRD